MNNTVRSEILTSEAVYNRLAVITTVNFTESDRFKGPRGFSEYELGSIRNINVLGRESLYLKTNFCVS